MAVEQEVRALIEAGRQADAIVLVEREAAAGDTWSQFCLAQWKLQGQGVPLDVAGAVGWLERASAAGMAQASMALTTFYATGTGCGENPARARELLQGLRSSLGFAEAQMRVLEQVVEPQDIAFETLSEAPLVRIYRGVLAPVESRSIRELAQPLLEPSFVIDPASGRRIPHPVRTSTGMSFGPLNENLVINRINRRIARLTGTEYSWAEPLHVLRYTPGQQYRAHVDALPGISNQRQLTAILFCNQGFGGGATVFPQIGLEVRGNEGDMLLFANTLGDGRSNPASEHAGLPVTVGEKWIATRWIRQRRYHPWEPETAR